jgi:predicted unusual protein kinase regulating ubiquinone biosynthesis (AarF/ABC1/UbiB family)
VIRIVALAVNIGLSYWIHYSLAPFFSAERNRLRRARLHGRKAAKLRQTAITLKGVLIKLGQFLSARVDLLPEEYTRELAQLQDSVPPAEFGSIRLRLREELGAEPETAFARFNATPVAAASLGQVHEAWLSDGRRVAVKVQYPGIEQIVVTDLRAVWWATRLLQLWFHRIRFDVLYREFARLLEAELDYLQEGRNAERFRTLFQDEPRILAPEVIWDRSTTRVLTLEYLEGTKITDYAGLEARGIELRAVARLVMESYMQQLFRHRFLHGDPHPGNLFVRPGPGPGDPPRLIFVDFGLMQAITPEMREGIKMTVGGVIERDVPAIVRGLRRLGFIGRDPDVASIEQVATFFIEKYRDISPRAIREIGLDDIAADLEKVFSISSALQVPNNFILIWRVVGMLSGLCARLDPDLNIIELAKPYALPFIRPEQGWVDTLLTKGRDLGLALASLPPLLAEFLSQANRGEFRTKMSSDDVTGAIRRLHTLVVRFGLALLILGLMLGATVLDRQAAELAALGARLLAALLGLALARSFLRELRAR